MRNLPATGEWLMRPNWFENAPFAVLNVEFNALPSLRGSVRIGPRNSKKALIGQLAGLTKTAPDTFLASYSIGANSGSFTAQYLDNADLTVDFRTGTVIGSFEARVQEVSGDSLLRMTDAEKLAAAINKALPMLPGAVADDIRGLLTYEALSFMALVATVWSASHWSPVAWIAWIADGLLLTIGVACIGMDICDVAENIHEFGRKACNAKTEQDLDEAAHHFAAAVKKVGVYAVFWVLFAKAPKPFKESFRDVQLKPCANPPTTPGSLFYQALRPKRANLPEGVKGNCDGYGNISFVTKIRKNGQIVGRRTLIEIKKTLIHEHGHAFFSPKLQVLREFRVQLADEGYLRSHLMRYLEEALVETNSRVRVEGLSGVWGGIRFPVKNGYVTIAKMGLEALGIFLGPIFVTGETYLVFFEAE